MKFLYRYRFWFIAFILTAFSSFAFSTTKESAPYHVKVLLLPTESLNEIHPFAQLYIAPGIRELRSVFQETQRRRHSELASNMRSVTVGQTYGSNLNNTQIALSLPLLLFALNFNTYLPGDLGDELPQYERRLEKTYKNIIMAFFSINPFPYMSYDLFIKNPSVNYLGIETLEQITWYYGAGPYIDSLLFRRNEVSTRNFGFAFSWPF